MRTHLDDLKKLSRGVKVTELNNLLGKVEKLEMSIQTLNDYKERIL